ncbi:hypothetical protein SAMN02746041_00011 [Desulfacinum hydrothermale DSM 13146]|uniref:Uncharacterized protein n=1 Tax=Desulfacinum hydrothermale DSM 13146 TaxID=1121390 RepID=A0A1W1WWW7_9BACT|nr:hypothetical protein [Desulfacinum hydrothermale]SMC16145.1 hypothetical protein SAMN02746041_00011 [Desulfacinum hydrothermale DSM 13146]
MTQTKTRYFLFPHSVLSEPAARCWATVGAALDCLRMVEPATLPPWAEPLCNQHGLEKDEGFWERVGVVLQGYRRVGTDFGQDGLMAALSREWSLGESPESRSHIQALLKGMAAPPADPAEWLLTEACVFLELGRELDQRELELVGSLQNVSRLEGQLLETLGADEEEEDELQRALETANPPLSPEWGHFTYLLRLRIGFWFRLFSRLALQDDRVVLTALNRDVVDEVLDPFQTERERRGEAWRRDERVLLDLPRLDLLGPEPFQDFRLAFQETGAGEHLARALDAYVQDETEENRKALDMAADALEEAVGAVLERVGPVAGPGGYRLVLTRPLDVRLSDVWRRFDRQGGEELGGDDRLQAPAVFLHVEPHGAS